MHWLRVGPAASARTAFLALAVAVLLIAASVVLAVVTAWPWALVAVPGLLLAGLSWRLFVRGLYVSDQGVRVRLVLRTVTFGWAAVHAMRPREVSAAPGTAQVAARHVCFDLEDGRTIDAPVYGLTDFDDIVVDLQRRRAEHAG